MKKNAALIAGIMFVTGCASSYSQRTHYDTTQDTSATVSSSYAYSDHDDISADSTKRGGSLDARGYDQDANNDEVEGTPDPLNPGKKADSSIRGGSIFAREREWNHDSEPHSGVRESDRHMKADSSIRGGSVEARGAREARGDYEGAVDVKSDADFHSEFDDRSTEINNDASVGGAASTDVGEGSSSLSLQGAHEDDLNSSEKLEENISGEYDIEVESSLRSSTGSASTTDIHHDEADLNAIESAGAAASAEGGSGASSDEFQSNDPAMHRSGSPLGTAGGEPNFVYRDNRAHGVGSATSGDFANAPVNQGVAVGDDQLAVRVKSQLSSESTGTYGLMSREVTRNIQVSAANGEITLTGTVPSEKHKDLIEIRAREIAGVHKVNNQLTVTPEADATFRDATRGSDLEDVTSELQD